MTATRSDTAFLLDLCGRIMFTHGLDPVLAVSALQISPEEAQSLVEGTAPAPCLDEDQVARLPLVANILVRLEVRCHHDSRAICQALDTPLAMLGNMAPARLLGGDLETLRMVRASIDTVTVPTVRWWRVGH